MRTPIGLCNVVTGEHSQAYRRPGEEPAPEITIPSLRARLSIGVAKELAEDLLKAVLAAHISTEPTTNTKGKTT